MTSTPTLTLDSALDYLYHWEKVLPNKNYLSQPINGNWSHWTWAEATQEVRQMAAAIRDKGYAPGSCIAILSKNCAHWILADLAIQMSGHVSVPIYPNVNAETVQYILTHSESKLLFVGKLDAPNWNEMKPGIPAGIDLISFGKYDLADAPYPTWEEAIESWPPLEGNPVRDPQEMMTLIYTSGTTGLPKGVMLNFEGPAFGMTFLKGAFQFTENDRFFSYLPLSHIAERMLVFMGSVFSGASIHFAESLDTFNRDLKVGKPTIFLAVPRIWTKFMTGILAKMPQSRLNLLLAIPVINNVIRKKIREGLGLTEARVFLTGAAHTPPSLQEWFFKLGITIFEVYGMTENCAYSHGNFPWKFKFGHAGAPLPDQEWKFTEEGEICVKSKALMMGYFKEPEKTTETIKDGYLHTGDQGQMTPDGFLEITGRIKDLFKTSKAKYVAPIPIEMKLSRNPLIEQVCVVGDGLPQPIALLVLTPEAMKMDRDALKETLTKELKSINSELEHHEHLDTLVVVKEPWTVENQILTPSLKIKRNLVDKLFGKNYEAWSESRQKVIWES